MDKHIPVMLDECIKALNVNADGKYVDLTLGRGGHSSEILKKLENGTLYSFDKDKTAIIESGNRLSKIGSNFQLVHSDYKNFKDELNKMEVSEVDGILADLGVSSPQLDVAERGFSYNKEARLDMRMDQTQELDAFIVVNEWSEQKLVDIFRYYADVMLPRRVAKSIVSNRPIETTTELVAVIKDSLPAAVLRKKNPAKAVFQAIRIAVNTELDSLKEMLDDTTSMIKVGGSIAIITFHSIEDRIVKRYFGTFIKDNTGKLPIIVEKKWKAKAYRPTKSEIEINRRSRSAKLRVLTRLG